MTRYDGCSPAFIGPVHHDIIIDIVTHEMSHRR
jgi:hypothetical protein